MRWQGEAYMHERESAIPRNGKSQKKRKILTFLCLTPMPTAAAQMAKVPRFATVPEGSNKKKSTQKVVLKRRKNKGCRRKSLFFFAKTTKGENCQWAKTF